MRSPCDRTGKQSHRSVSVWPDGAPSVGETAERSRTVEREDRPITELATTVTREAGEVALEGTAVCYTMDVSDTESTE